ncbi:LCP family protein [Paenibacillus sp. PL2-23]|uniref:LCP family protein n=1 Tax=Paenibacillus sp. PL2-23 TaxID=2100729 RepID=UPI0030F50121
MKKIKKSYIFGMIALVLLTAAYMNRQTLAMAGFDWFLQGEVEDRLADTYKPVDRDVKTVPVPVSAALEEDPFSVLLIGVDQRDNEIGRSDTLIYTVVRPSDGSMLLVSLPRDLYVELAGKGRADKINHAFAFGGAGLTMDTVEQLLDAPVDHYASINFEGFREAINAIGGIALPIEEDIVNDDPGHEYFVIEGGQDLYNGTDALNFVRYREDAGGDVSRTERHQQFLHAMIEKAKGMKQWSQIPELIDIMGDNFSTDMTPGKLIDLAQRLIQADNRMMYSHTLLGYGHRLVQGGAWYYFADEEDLASVQTMIRSWLDADTTQASLRLPPKYEELELQQKEVQSLAMDETANETE